MGIGDVQGRLTGWKLRSCGVGRLCGSLQGPSDGNTFELTGGTVLGLTCGNFVTRTAGKAGMT